MLHAIAYYILFTYLIPISLFVSLEISRVFQALFMYGDEGMRAEDGTRMRPQNSNLNEDLGRVRFAPASFAPARPPARARSPLACRSTTFSPTRRAR